MYNLYVVSPSDTIESIAQKYNVTPTELYAINSFLNPNTPLKVGQRIIVPIPKIQNFKYYTVKKGDSLYNISKKNNINANSDIEMDRTFILLAVYGIVILLIMNIFEKV